MEADLHRYAEVDLCGIWTGALSFRKLGVLYRKLPQEALTKAEQWDALTPAERLALPKREGHGPWSRLELLTARNGDALDWLVWAKTEAAAKGGNPPDPFPRPGVEGKHGQVIEITDGMRAKWQAIRDNRGAVS